MIAESVRPPFTVWTAKDLARMLVNQLFDVAKVPVATRQSINDTCDDYVATMIVDWVRESEHASALTDGRISFQELYDGGEHVER